MADTVHTFEFAPLDPSVRRRVINRDAFEEGVQEGIALAGAQISRLENENSELRHLLTQAQEQAIRYTHSVEELDGAARALHDAVQQWRRRDTLALKDIEQDVIAFAFDVAATILGEIPLPEQLRAALNQLKVAETAIDAARVRMHPDTVAALSAIPGGWAPHPTNVVTDDTITPGEVVCEIGDRRISAGFTTALSNLRRTVLGADDADATTSNTPTTAHR